MVTGQTTIRIRNGFHMRPANLFVREMGRFASSVAFLYRDNVLNAKSIMNLMTACIPDGAELTVRCEGPDEQDALARAVELLESEEVSKW